MGMFDKKDGEGEILVKFCGYLKNSKGQINQGWGIKRLQPAKNAADAKSILKTFLKNGSIKDGSEKSISSSNGYSIGGYSFIKSDNGTYSHLFNLVNEEDHYCNSGGRIRRQTRKTRGKRSKKSRKTRRNRKY
jgi:hypothetical protein